MKQLDLMHMDIYEAISADIAACGGFKKVGSTLFPEKPVEEAGRLLARCVDTSRAEKLSIEHYLMIKRLAKAHNSFSAVFYECDEIGLTHPAPIEPEDERARLQRDFITAVEQLNRLQSRLSKSMA